MEAKKAKEKITKVRFSLLLDHPFIGELSLRLSLVDAKQCSTMGTDGIRLIYNPDYVDKLSNEHLAGVIAHEIAHCMVGHVGKHGKERGNKFPKEVWDIACEYIANHIVIDLFNLTLPGKYYYNEKYRNGEWTTEMVARDLMEQQKMNAENTEYGGKQQQNDKLGEYIIDDHSILTSENITEQNITEHSIQTAMTLETEWKIWVVQASQNARRRGELPSGLERFIDDLTDPKIDWRTLLAEFMVNHATKDDYSWTRLNKRYLYRKIYAPALYSRSAVIGVGIDTSGSIPQETLRDFISELTGIISAVPDIELHIWGCDAGIHHYQHADDLNDIDISALCKGGGGTSFVPVFKDIQEREIDLDCLIYLTDGDGEYPKDPPQYPVLWAIHGDTKPPWGRVCHI